MHMFKKLKKMILGTFFMFATSSAFAYTVTCNLPDGTGWELNTDSWSVAVNAMATCLKQRADVRKKLIIEAE